MTLLKSTPGAGERVPCEISTLAKDSSWILRDAVVDSSHGVEVGPPTGRSGNDFIVDEVSQRSRPIIDVLRHSFAEAFGHPYLLLQHVKELFSPAL